MKIFLQFVGICVFIGVLGSLAGNGQPGAAVAIAAFAIALVLIWYANLRAREKAWKNRAQRLCTNCLAQAQPYKKQNGELYCPHCQADNPAPLESPFAREYFARQQQSA